MHLPLRLGVSSCDALTRRPQGTCRASRESSHAVGTRRDSHEQKGSEWAPGSGAHHRADHIPGSQVRGQKICPYRVVVSGKYFSHPPERRNCGGGLTGWVDSDYPEALPARQAKQEHFHAVISSLVFAVQVTAPSWSPGSTTGLRVFAEHRGMAVMAAQAGPWRPQAPAWASAEAPGAAITLGQGSKTSRPRGNVCRPQSPHLPSWSPLTRKRRTKASLLQE